MMRDPWHATLDMLTGGVPAPAVCWPREQTRLVLLARDEPEEPDEGEPALSPAELEVLQLLRDDGASAGELAARLQLALGAVYARCCRMRARGLIRSSGRGFWTIADGSPPRQIEPGDAIAAAAVA